MVDLDYVDVGSVSGSLERGTLDLDWDSLLSDPAARNPVIFLGARVPRHGMIGRKWLRIRAAVDTVFESLYPQYTRLAGAGGGVVHPDLFAQCRGPWTSLRGRPNGDKKRADPATSPGYSGPGRADDPQGQDWSAAQVRPSSSAGPAGGI